MSRLWWQLEVASLLGLVSILGCGDSSSVKKPAPSSAPQKQAAVVVAQPKGPKPDFSGVVTGIVKLAPGVQLPLGPDPKTSEERVASPPAPCSPWGDLDRRLVRQSATTQGLSPIHVAITEMRAAPDAQPRIHEVRIEDCRLTPTLLGGKLGDEVRVTNQSDVPLLPALPGDPFMRALLKGQSRSFKLERMGPTSITCGFGAFCGESMIIALSHSLYGVTDDEGEFKVERLPLDQDLMLHAWHPLFVVASQRVRLSETASQATVELLLVPKAAPANEAESATPSKPADTFQNGAKKKARPRVD